MGLQWMILAYVAAAEAAIAVVLTLPSPKLLKSRLVSLVSLILRPSMFIIPFSAFHLLDIYWKNEHRLMCTGETCTAFERDRYEKSAKSHESERGAGSPLFMHFCGLGLHDTPKFKMYKAQRNVILCTSACLLYWVVCRICQCYNEIQRLEEAEKRLKEE